MDGIRLGLLVGSCALIVACGGKSAPQGAPGSGAGAGNASAGASGGTSNGAVTPELSSTGLPLDSVLGQLDAAAQSTLCAALGQWAFRLRDPSCNAFVESAVLSNPTTIEGDRMLCADNLGICHKPEQPSPLCVSFSAGCAVTVAELDHCFADNEKWLAAVPSCEVMTYATGAREVGPSSPSCAAYNTCLESP
jgi:hypothetical protein